MPTSMKNFLLVCLGLGLAGASASGALLVYHYDEAPASYNRFSSFSITAPKLNTDASFVGAAFDLSGWGWDAGGWSVSLISPLHFVQAQHAHTAVGETVYFVNSSGVLVSATVAAQVNVGGDLSLGTLSAPIAVDSGIRAFSLAVGDERVTYGDTLLVSGRSGLLGTNTVESSYSYLTYDYDAVTGEAMPQSGDSSSPTFVVDNGVLRLAAVHSYVNKLPDPTFAYDTQLSLYFPVLQQNVSSSGYSLTAVPEMASASMMLGVCGALWVLVDRRRWRRGRAVN